MWKYWNSSQHTLAWATIHLSNVAPANTLEGEKLTRTVSFWKIPYIYFQQCMHLLLEWVRSLGREDPLEKEMATHTNIVALKIPWTESGRLQIMGLQGVGHNLAAKNAHTHTRIYEAGK